MEESGIQIDARLLTECLGGQRAISKEKGQEGNRDEGSRSPAEKAGPQPCPLASLRGPRGQEGLGVALAFPWGRP